MNKIGHRNGAIVVMTSLYLLKGVNLETLITSVGIWYGAFIPDVDADYSYIQTKIPKISKAYKKLPKNMIFKHRGLLLHSVYTLLFLFFMFYITHLNILLGLFLGVLSHHVLDFKIRNYFFPF